MTPMKLKLIRKQIGASVSECLQQTIVPCQLASGSGMCTVKIFFTRSEREWLRDVGHRSVGCGQLMSRRGTGFVR